MICFLLTDGSLESKEEDDDFLITTRVREEQVRKIGKILLTSQNFHLGALLLHLGMNVSDVDRISANQQPEFVRIVRGLVEWTRRFGDEATFGKLAGAVRQQVVGKNLTREIGKVVRESWKWENFMGRFESSVCEFHWRNVSHFWGGNFKWRKFLFWKLENLF